MLGNQKESGAKRRACDECRRRKIGCFKQQNGCANCNDIGIHCSHSDQKRMGRPRKLISERQWQPIASRPEAKPVEGHGHLHEAETPMSHFNGYNNGSNGFSTRGSDSSHQVLTTETDKTQPSVSEALLTERQPSILNDEDLLTAERPTVSAEPNQQPGICLCMTIIVSALDALSSLPADAEEAVRLARSGSMALREVMISPCCGIIGGRSNLNNAITSRNVHIVCMLVPTIVKAFSRALHMVDSEVSSAQMEERTLSFDIRRLGGLSKALQRAHSTCEDSRQDLPAEPDEWRVLVRVLLRADIYGYHSSEASLSAIEPDSHLGLWEALIGLEGLLKGDKNGGPTIQSDSQHDMPVQGKPVLKDHVQLLQVLALAKSSLDTLVIP